MMDLGECILLASSQEHLDKFNLVLEINYYLGKKGSNV